jgi:DNA-binding NarL/FixJ family response regulator
MSEGAGARSPEKRRILIVDGNPLLRRGLAALIRAEPDLAVCAEAATAREARDAIAACDPALVIADFSFEPGLGLDLVREICMRHPGLPVLMMSIDDGPVYVERARAAGAVGHVSKQALNGSVLAAIGAALESRGASPGGGRGRVSVRQQANEKHRAAPRCRPTRRPPIL